MLTEPTAPLWSPSQETVKAANITRFQQWLSKRYGVNLTGYRSLHQWSIEHPELFWPAVWEVCGVIGEQNGTPVSRHYPSMPGTLWFPDATLNFAQNLLRRRDEVPAMVCRSETREEVVWSHSKLHDEVFRISQSLRDCGVGRGDVVVGWLPNIPEAVAIALAAVSLGAIWASCSSDFGLDAVVDRFGPLSPKVLFAVDGYMYRGVPHSCLDRLEGICNALPALIATVLVPYLDPQVRRPKRNAISLYDNWIAVSSGGELIFEMFPFNHPLYVLFSSGTTGKPKGIIHGAGGTLLQHLKEHQLHVNIKSGDRIFYHTTCGWMMWNWLISALASDATLLLYDGDPMHPKPDVLFDFAAQQHANVFGISASYLDAIRQKGVRPADTHALADLRMILSTGSPLSPAAFDDVYDRVKRSVCVASISGGTDIISCFALGNPTLPVFRGEIQCKGLGMDVAVFAENGRTIEGSPGELVCRSPFPSMPLGLWDDFSGEHYRETYFSRYPGVWHHGDYAEITAHHGMIIYGRSDATLNPGGVRIGTAEIYQQLDRVPEVLESVAVGQQWENDTRIILFVKLVPGMELGRDLTEHIKRTIRTLASPRHVPAKILQVSDVPRTKSGKVSEMAVRAAIHGHTTNNLSALANPEALDHFKNRPELT